MSNVHINLFPTVKNLAPTGQLCISKKDLDILSSCQLHQISRVWYLAVSSRFLCSREAYSFKCIVLCGIGNYGPSVMVQ